MRGKRIFVNPHFMLAALAAAGMASGAQAISVDTGVTGGDLAQAILGSGVAITGVSYVGATDQAGTFTDGGVIGIEEGILLTTGDARLAPGPNFFDNAGADLSTAGDLDLSLIVGNVTFDANVLEINFTTETGDLFFDYAFASEEYNEFVGLSYNDAFAFIVDGTTNVAIAPDGQTVAINNVNCGNPFGGAGPNCDSFNNNDPDDPEATLDIEYDGLTDVFTASILGLDAGEHTLKLVIADVSDGTLDSAVFIEAGSFSATPASVVPEPSGALLAAVSLLAVKFRSRRKRRA